MRIIGWAPGYYYNQFILDEIAKRFDYDSKELRFCTVQEVYNILDGREIERSLLVDRMKGFVFVIEDDKSFVYSKDKAQEMINSLAEKDDFSNIKEIKGNTAMQGKVVGKVLVFKWTDSMEEKIKQITDNSILVTGQTRPQIMPLISKCKAIITDEGGITSHAAIVSRELRTPCIIGTKIATQVLKDGDIVEVDADNGIVKILNKNG
jgi:phosphohistidine swiveling domain-containing protein